MDRLRKERQRLVTAKRAKAKLGLWLINTCSILSWGLILPVLLLIDHARPSTVSVFARLLKLNTQMDSEWDETALIYAFILMLAMAGISAIGLVINTIRYRLNHESYRWNLIAIFLMALAGCTAVMLFLRTH